MTRASHAPAMHPTDAHPLGCSWIRRAPRLHRTPLQKQKKIDFGKRGEKPIRPNKGTQETGLGRKISKTHRENEATGTEDRTVWHALRIDLRSAISICRVASASLLRNRTKYKQKGRGNASKEL